MSRAVSLLLVTPEARVQCPCELCGAESDLYRFFSDYFGFPLFHSSNDPYTTEAI